MSSCCISQGIENGQATFVLVGRFEGADAWDLVSRLNAEPRVEVVLDFSRVDEFVDYSIAVLASALLGLAEKRVHLRGIRTHQLRMLHYFGVEPSDLLRPLPGAAAETPRSEVFGREVT